MLGEWRHRFYKLKDVIDQIQNSNDSDFGDSDMTVMIMKTLLTAVPKIVTACQKVTLMITSHCQN